MFVEKQIILINSDLISKYCHFREKNLRVFIFGDYAYVCCLFHLGANDRETIILVFAKHTY